MTNSQHSRNHRILGSVGWKTVSTNNTVSFFFSFFLKGRREDPQSNKSTSTSVFNDSSLHDSSPQYPLLTGNVSNYVSKMSSSCSFILTLIGFFFILYLSYFKIIIPFKTLLTQRWIFSDEIHHWITSLISFSWKCYIWPQKYLIYYRKDIKMISCSSDSDMVCIIIL